MIKENIVKNEEHIGGRHAKSTSKINSKFEVMKSIIITITTTKLSLAKETIRGHVSK
jgi:hypothetical protein